MKNMEIRRKELEEAYREARQWLDKNAPDGWNHPPALIPQPAELALGIGYDPTRNTR